MLNHNHCYFQLIQSQKADCRILATAHYLGQPIKHRNEEPHIRHTLVVQVTDSFHQLWWWHSWNRGDTSSKQQLLTLLHTVVASSYETVTDGNCAHYANIHAHTHTYTHTQANTKQTYTAWGDTFVSENVDDSHDQCLRSLGAVFHQSQQLRRVHSHPFHLKWRTAGFSSLF